MKTSMVAVFAALLLLTGSATARNILADVPTQAPAPAPATPGERVTPRIELLNQLLAVLRS